MKSLKINGEEVQIKLDYNFYNRLIERTKNKDKSEVDGFNQLIAGLVDQDPDAIITFYQSAVVGKKRPTRADVEKALTNAGVWDEEDPFGEVYKELQGVGFLKLKINHLLHTIKEDIQTSKAALEVTEEANDNSKDSKAEIKEAKNTVALAKKRYELTKMFLEQLGK